mgnify:CR=1 FL=1
MRTGKLYDFAPILNNSIHIRIFNPSIFASVDSIKFLIYEKTFIHSN